MSSKVLINIYTSILRFAGLEPDDNGLISNIVDDHKEPTMIGNTRLVLPIDSQLRNFNPTEKMIFHPLTENVFRGESEVLKKLKNVINIKLNFTIGIISQSLLNLIASPELHSKLSPEQTDLLVNVSEADEKTVVNFITQMVNGIKTKPDRLFSNIYIKRGGTCQGKRFSRVGIVSFPFYEDLRNDKIDKIRVKDKETYKQLFEFIFPGINTAESYNFGSETQVAPNLEALLRSAANIACRLNDLIILYKDFIDDSDILLFDADWLDYFYNLNDLAPEIRKVPVQHGNDGSISVTDENEPETTQLPVQYHQPTQVAQPVPMQYQQPVQSQFMPPPAKPELKHTKRGLDFKSIVQTNPSLSFIPNQLAPQLMQPMQQQVMQQRTPGWVQPQQSNQLPINSICQTPNGPMIMTPNGLMPYQQMQQPINTIPGWNNPVYR